jgi:hypothetical protein
MFLKTTVKSNLKSKTTRSKKCLGTRKHEAPNWLDRCEASNQLHRSMFAINWTSSLRYKPHALCIELNPFKHKSGSVR